MEALVLIAGTYALTLALTESDGAWGIMYRIRKWKPIDDFGLLNCHLCTSFWVALILSFIIGIPGLFLLGWGASSLIDKLVNIALSR